MPPESGFNAVVLAAQRAGVTDPLAAKHGLSHKAMVPIAGAPLIAHVLRALVATPGLARIRVVVEAEMAEPIRALLPDAPLDFVAAADNLADSVKAGCVGSAGRIIVTTADNVLLTPGAVTQMLAALVDAQAAFAMAREAAVRAAHADGQRRFYRFADDAYSNCNLYGFANADVLSAAEIFRSGGQFAKKPLRLIGAIGPINLALLLLKRLTLAGAAKRLSRRLGIVIAPVVIADGAHAIDVDNDRTHGVAAELLARRAAA